VGVLIFLQMCKNVTVYGYGHDHPPEDRSMVPYHYFTGFGARQSGVSVHSWHTEVISTGMASLAKRTRLHTP
jgi:hypothetical protein